jgi:hypothetical protein
LKFSRDKADHNLTGMLAIIDPIYQSPPEFDSEGGREVYMVGQGEELPEKAVEEIAREAEEEIARAARLAKEAKKGKRHNNMQDNSRSSDDEPRDGAPLRRHHMKLNSRCPAGQDRLRDRSRSIREEISWIKYHGEQVYHMPAHNALTLRMCINQLTPHLPKDNEEVNAHVKHFQAMLDAAIVVDPVLDHDDRVWGQELDHQ